MRRLPLTGLRRIDDRRLALELEAQLHQALFLILFPGHTIMTLNSLTVGDLITEMHLRTLQADAELQQLAHDTAFRRRLSIEEADAAKALAKAQKRAALAQFLDPVPSTGS